MNPQTLDREDNTPTTAPSRPEQLFQFPFESFGISRELNVEFEVIELINFP